jgi:hypothetical protein
MSEEKVFEVAGVETVEKPLEDGGTIKYPKPEENRRKKALLKKIEKEEEEKAKDEKIAKHILKKDSKDEEISKLKNDIDEMKAKPSTPSNDAKLEKMQQNMVLLGQVVDHLVKENNDYKKRKETKRKEKEERQKQWEQDAKRVAEEQAKPKKVFDTQKNKRTMLQGML